MKFRIICHALLFFISEIQTEKAKKKQRLKQMEPLLTACDELRDDLNSSGVKIQVCSVNSSVVILHAVQGFFLRGGGRAMS